MVFRLRMAYLPHKPIPNYHSRYELVKYSERKFKKIMAVVGKAIKDGKQVKFWYENNIIQIEITE